MPKALVLGGATGLLGQALMRVLPARGWKAEALGRGDGDIANPAWLKERIESSAPYAVFNTIAWTQVDDAEDHEDEATAVNRALPDALARIVKCHDTMRLVHFSTDFVFGACHTGAWREDDRPNPESVYGRTKLEGERAIMSILPDRSLICRTAWLFGPGHKNFVDTILNACRNREIINVVADQVGSPTYTLDLANWSASLAEKGASGIWHCVNSGSASWCELASEAVHLMNEPCRVAAITSAEWPQKAHRPANSALDNGKLAQFLGEQPRPWPKALRDYLFGEFQAHHKEARS